MVNYDFIKSQHSAYEYCLKNGTKHAYHYCSGQPGLLPNSLYISNYTGKSGIRQASYQLQGTYKKNEPGLWKDINNGKIHTKIISNYSFPSYLGWGEIDERFNVYDLLILKQSFDKNKIDLHVFRGLSSPNYLESVFEYLNTYYKRESPL